MVNHHEILMTKAQSGSILHSKKIKTFMLKNTAATYGS